MFFVYVVTALGVYAQYKLGKDDDEVDYRRSLPMIEARLDRESARLDKEISRLLREHRRLCDR
jgi:hypothetical protein